MIVYYNDRNQQATKAETGINRYQNIAVVYNPAAGKVRRHGPGILGSAQELLGRNGAQVQLVPTPGPRTGGTLARQLWEGGADLILAVGGDGTINEVLQGMVHAPAAMAILPGGTANVLSLELGFGSDWDQAVQMLDQCVEQTVTVGKLSLDVTGECRYFHSMAGVGFDAEAVHRVDLDLKKRVGKLAYWASAATLASGPLKQFVIEVDGKKYRRSFLLASRVRKYGGEQELARNVTLLDDDLELVLLEGKSLLPYLKYYLGVVSKRLYGMEGVTVLRSSKVRLYPLESREARPDDGVYVQVDGEMMGSLPATVTVEPAAVKFLVPSGYGQAPAAK